MFDDEYLTFDQNSKQWEEFRENTVRFGASTIGKLFGPRAYITYLYDYKRRVLEKYQEEWEKRLKFNGNEYTQYGHLNEEDSLKSFFDFASSKLFDNQRIEIRKIGSFLGSKEDETIFYCSPDAMMFVFDKSKDNFEESVRMLGIETKCPWNSRNIPLKIEDINLNHVCQSLQCLHLTEAEYWFLCYYDGRTDPKRLVVYKIEKNPLAWKMIKEKAQEVYDLAMNDKLFSKACPSKQEIEFNRDILRLTIKRIL